MTLKVSRFLLAISSMAAFILIMVGSVFFSTKTVHAILVRCNDETTQEASVEALDRGANPCLPSHGGIADGQATSGSEDLDYWLQAAVNLLSAAVGMVIVISLIIAGIQYTTAGGNASQVAAAKGRITMAILALVMFVFAYGILQWLVPGGVF